MTDKSEKSSLPTKNKFNCRLAEGAAIAFLLIIFSFPAYAGFCSNPTPDNPEGLGEVYYAGALKIISARKASSEEDPYPDQNLDGPKALPIPPGYIYTLQPIQPYQGNQTENFQVWHNGAVDGWSGPQNGEIFVDIIGKINDVPSFKKLCNPAKTMEKFGIKTPENIFPAFAAEKEKCLKEGKELRFPIQIGICDTRTKDFQKECSSNSDCEGFCVVQLTPEEMQQGIRPDPKDIEIVNDEDPITRWSRYATVYPLNKKGQCSEWQLEKGCFYTPGHDYEGQKGIREECNY